MTFNRRKLSKTRQLELLEKRLVLAGVPSLIPINPTGSSFPRDFFQVGDVAFFVADDGVSGRELWSTDGQTASLVLDINPGGGSSDPKEFTELNGLLYFVADNGVDGAELWRSDGTAAGTSMVRDIFPGEGYQANYGVGGYSSNPTDMISANGRLFFSAIDKDHGRELWMSDGTEAGTQLVRDIAAGADTSYDEVSPHSSSPANLVNLDGTIYFTADDGTSGRELWRSDGTEAGTQLVRDLRPGDEPYYYDGYYYGTRPGSSAPTLLTPANGLLLFTAETIDEGRELWRTDGTESGTQLVKDIAPGPNGGFLGNRYDTLVELNGFLFFAADDDQHGRELWISDGTADGTSIVRDINMGIDNGMLGADIVAIGNEVFFSADDAVHGSELWKSDGSAEGTQIVRDIEQGIDGSYPETLTRVGGRLFFAAETTETGVEVFESDGTEPGTLLTADLIEGATSSFPEEFGSLDSRLLVSASATGEGRELWVIDTTAAQSTRMATLKLIIDGQIQSLPANIGIAADGTVLSQVHTDDQGAIKIESINGEPIQDATLGDLFDIWRTNAGVAGNNPNAHLSPTQLLDNEAMGQFTVQMFVNGIARSDYDDYVIQDGDEIVLVYSDNPVVSVNTNFGSLLFELLEEEAPLTVQNFLNYVNDGDYENTFFHRYIPGFVIQGGGFRTSSEIFTSTDQFTPIEDDPPVPNEPGVSNTRGTVAMAKLGGDPDSATNQFFINLGDNSSNLDNQNGGFTVFARVLDMSTVEQLEAVPTRDIDGGLYSDLPVTEDDRLIVIRNVSGAGLIEGIRFEDKNANGTRDADEPGLPNAIVFLDENNNGLRDSNEIATVTDNEGRFTLATTKPSTVVRIEPSSNRVLTTSNDAFEFSIGVGPVTGALFGEAEPSLTDAIDDAFTVSDRGGRQLFDVLANDIAADGQSLTLVSVTPGSGGGIVSIEGNEIAYEARADFSGTETFTYTVRDSQGISDTATVTVTVADTSVSRIAGFVFIDTDGDGERSSNEVGVPGAEIRLSGRTPSGRQIKQRVLTGDDGSYSFDDIPPGTYTVAQRQPRALVNGSASTSKEGVVIAANRLSNIELEGGDPVTDANFAEQAVKPKYISITWFFASSGRPQRTFRQMMALAEELSGNNALATEIREGTGTTPVDDGTDTTNRAPVAVADTYSVAADQTLSRSAANGVLRNDTDPDGDVLAATISQQPTNGTLVFNSDGSFTYTPNAGFTGTDSFSYVASDPDGLTSQAVVTIVVERDRDTFSVSESAPTGTVIGTLTADDRLDPPIVFELVDSDIPDALKLRPDDHFQGGAAAPLVLIEYLDFQCPVCATYHPIVNDLVDEFGNDLLVVQRHLPLDSIHPNAREAAIAAEAASRQGAFDEYADVLFANQSEWQDLTDPTPVFERYATDLGLDLTQFQNDMADPALRDRVERDATNAASLGVTSTPAFYLNGDRLENLPNDFNEFESLIDDRLDDVDDVFAIDRLTGDLLVANGAAIDFELRSIYPLAANATDIDGDTIPILFVVNVINENEASPIAVEDSYDVTQGMTLAVNAADGVLVNDSDADGDDLEAVLVSGASHGTLSLSADGSFTYIPDADFTGTDVFTYEASDGEKTSDTVTVTIRVLDGNQAPIANDDAFNTNRDTALSVTAENGVLANDVDPDGDPLTVILVDQPSSGTLVLESDGAFVYTPIAGFVGSDQFTYRANDGSLDSLIATVTVTVAGVNSVPSAVPDTYSTTSGTPLSLDSGSGILANDSDPDGDPLSAEIVTPPQHGSLTLNADGSFVYTPDDSFVGEDSFVYVAKDATSQSDATTVTITVLPVNEPPVANADSYATDVDTVLNVDAANGVLANDVDADGDNLTAQLVEGPSSGTLSLSPDGSFEFVPESGISGAVSFTYQASDGVATSSPATVTITIESPNQLPIGTADNYVVTKNTPLVVDATNGLLANDSDGDGDPLVVDDVVSPPAHGVVSVDADGAFLYTPNTDFIGIDTFTYRVSDGRGLSDEITVTLNVMEPVDANTDPMAQDDRYETEEDIPLTVLALNGVLANDIDLDGDNLTATIVQPPAHGTVDLLGSGAFAYTPTANFHGTDFFIYEASDGRQGSSRARVEIIVESINDRPVARPDRYSVNADLLLAVNSANGVLKNDFDIDGDSLIAELVDDITDGTLDFRSDGSFDFAPNPEFSGTATFTYRVFDGIEFSTPTTVDIDVLNMNVAPTAVADSYFVPVDAVLQVLADDGVLANDVDPNGDLLSATLVDGVRNGALQFDSDGSFTYTPNSGFHGTDTFRYRVSDGQLESATVLVALFVNDAPIAHDDHYVGLVNQTLTVPVEQSILVNDVDPNDDGLSIVVTSTPSRGMLMMNNLDGTFTYTPPANFTGSVSFTYHVNDSFVDSNEATVTIEIVDNLPVPATADVYTIREDQVLTVDVAGGVLANDNVSGSARAVLVQPPSNGELALAVDGSFVYTPHENFNGEDQFLYRVEVDTPDGVRSSEDVQVALTVLRVNDPPTGQPDEYTLRNAAQLTVAAEEGVLRNDEDIDGDTLISSVFTEPANGFVVLEGDGSFLYIPKAGFVGTDTFTYTASDLHASSEPTTVTIHVESTLKISVLPDEYTIREDHVLTVDANEGVLANDSHLDGSPLTVSIATDPLRGMVSLRPDGSFDYVPNADVHGLDSFSYTVTDGVEVSPPVTVEIDVLPVNDAPLGVDDTYTVTTGSTLSADEMEGVLGNDIDIDGDSLSATLVQEPSSGQLELNPDGSFTYTPNDGFVGVDRFTYTAHDDFETSDETMVTITVVESTITSVRAEDDDYAIREDQILSVNTASGVLANDSSTKGLTLTATIESAPANGLVRMLSDGSFTYTPNADYHGPDSFTYTATDGTDSDLATVRISVLAVDDPPIAAADTYEAIAGTPLVVPSEEGILANDIDIDNNHEDLTASLVTSPQHGELTLEQDGSFTYVPDSDFEGTDSFSYMANDLFKSSDETVVTINVRRDDNVVNLVPDEYVIREDHVLQIDQANGVLSNDQIISGGAVMAVITVGPQHGTVSMGFDGSFEYTPDSDFNGIDSFQYTVLIDDAVVSASATVTIEVLAVNDQPITTPDEYTAQVGLPLIVSDTAGVLANDVDIDDDDLTANLVTQPANGQLLFEPDGSFTYLANAGFVGDDSFAYTAMDEFETSDPTMVTIHVEGDQPTIITAADSYTIREDHTLVVPVDEGVLSNDVGTLTVSIDALPANGSVTLLSDGSFEYLPNPDFFGLDSFTYIATDGSVVSDATTVEIDVLPVNDPPVGVPDVYSVSVPALRVDKANGVLANDIDIDGDTLHAILIDDPTNGTLTLNDDGSFEYVPNDGFVGTDMFTYVATDRFRDTEIVTVTIHVGDTNQFNAIDDLYFIREDLTLMVNAETGVLANDVKSPTMNTVTVGRGPMHGSVTLNPDGSFEYTPELNFFGDDTFTYIASAGGPNEEATVVVRVQPVNDSPSSTEDFYRVDVDNVLVITDPANGVLANDSDIDGDPISAVLNSPTDVGQLEFNDDGTFTFTPPAEFSGVVTFTYIARDKFRASEVTTVTIQVGDMEDPFLGATLTTSETDRIDDVFRIDNWDLYLP